MFADSLKNVPLRNPKLREKTGPEDVNLDNSLEGPDTPARPPPKRRNGGKRPPSDSQEPDLLTSRYHLAPGKIPIKQRASSAPTPFSKHDEGFDINRLPELPGKYESQSSNIYPENDTQIQPMLSSVVSGQHQTEGEAEENADPPIQEDESTDDEDSQSSGIHVKKEYSSDDEECPDHSLLEQGPVCARKPQVHRTKADVPKCLPPPFIPYKCEKGNGEKREIQHRVTINFRILELIHKKQQVIQKPGERKDAGWVYVFESQEYGEKFLKIGQTKSTPDKRKKEFKQCGLNLKEIADKYENPFDFYDIVERIVHIELHNSRLKLQCHHVPSSRCRTNHDEWFWTDRKTASDSVKMWRSWLLKQHPYDSMGVLTPYWQWRAERLRTSVANVKWEEWTQPPKHDYYVFKFVSHFSQSRKDNTFYFVSILITVISYFGHGGRGAIWAIMGLLLL